MKKWMLRLAPALGLLAPFGLYLVVRDVVPHAALGLARASDDQPVKVEVVKTVVVPAGPSLAQVRDDRCRRGLQRRLPRRFGLGELVDRLGGTI